jgi:hypothetical protein
MNEKVPQRQSVRYGFNVMVEITDLQSQIQLKGQTSDLAMYGCGITSVSDFAPGTRVRVRLILEHSEVVTLGRVVYARPDIGMGIAFTRIEANDERVLAEWIDELEIQRTAPRDTPLLERY